MNKKMKKFLEEKYEKDPSPTGCECVLNLIEQAPEMLEKKNWREGLGISDRLWKELKVERGK